MSDNQEYNQIFHNITIAKNFTKGWHENIIRWRRLYRFDHYDTKPKSGESRFADPTYTNTVDLAVGIILANSMVWKAECWRPSVDISSASLVEKFLSGTLQVNADRNEYDIYYEVLLHFVRDGGAVIYTVWDEQIAASSYSMETLITPEGEQKEVLVYSENPLRVQVIDPLSIYVVPGGKNRWASVMRIENRSVFDVYSDFGIVLEEDRHLSSVAEQVQSRGELVDYWDVIVKDGKPVVRNCILYKGKVIRPLQEMERYRSIPYTIGFFKPTDRSDPDEWNSIITPLEHPVQHLEKSINRRQRQIDVFSSLPLVSVTQNGRQIAIDPGLGKVVQLSEGESLQFPVWPGNPPDVREHIEFLRSRVQQSGFSDVFYGSGASAISGYALSQLGDQNRIRLEQPIAHLEKFWSWWAKKTVDLAVSYAEEDFILMYGSYKGKMFYEALPVSVLKGHFITCEIIPEFPNEQVRKTAMATQVRGLLPETTIMEKYLGIQQPDEELDKKMTELALNNPVLVQYVVMKKLSEMADNGDEVAKMALQAMMSQIKAEMQQTENAPNPMQSPGLPNRPPRPYGQSLSGAVEDTAQTAPNMEGSVTNDEIF